MQGYNDSCYRRAEGDAIKAEELFNTTYFNYFHRISQYNKYVEWVNKNNKK